MNNTLTDRQTGYPSIDKPWLKYYAERARKAPLPEKTMYQYIWDNNKEHLSDVTLRYYGTKITYGKLFANIKRAASAFYAMGIQSGDIVTIMSMHTPETVCAIYALNYLGAVANMVYMTLSEKEVLKTLENTSSKLLLVIDAVLPKIEKIKEAIGIPVIVLGISDSMPFHLRLGYQMKNRSLKNSFQTWASFLNTGEELPPIADNHTAPAVIVYTSGTTGEPKGVVLSSDSFNAVIRMCNDSGKDYVRGETGLLILPPFFGFGISMLHLCINYGINSKLWIELTPDAIANAYQKEKPNRFVGGPAIVDGFFKHVHGNLSYIIEFSGGGGALAAEKEEALNVFLSQNGSDVKYTTGYGMTEFASAVCMQQKNCYKKDTLGIPLIHANIKVVDSDTNKELKYNETGELWVSTPAMMTEYFRNPKETDKVLKTDDNGVRWLRTGDLGYVDEDGFVHFMGRIKRIYITTGKNGNTINKIFPQRIEECLESNPFVESCGVCCLPDPIQTNISVAFVTLKKGSEKHVVVKMLLDFLYKELPEHHWPKVIHVIEKMPITPSGKIDYRVLEKMAYERHKDI